MANAVAECSWLRQLLQELSCPVDRATVVYCDNVSAVYLSANPCIIDGPSILSWIFILFGNRWLLAIFMFYTFLLPNNLPIS